MKSMFEDAMPNLGDESPFIDEPVEQAMVLFEELELPYYAATHQLNNGSGMAELYKHFIVNDTLRRGYSQN